MIFHDFDAEVSTVELVAEVDGRQRFSVGAFGPDGSETVFHFFGRMRLQDAAGAEEPLGFRLRFDVEPGSTAFGEIRIRVPSDE